MNAQQIVKSRITPSAAYLMIVLESMGGIFEGYNRELAAECDFNTDTLKKCREECERAGLLKYRLGERVAGMRVAHSLFEVVR